MKTLKSVNLLKLQKVWRSTASTTVESAGCLRTEYDKAKPFDDIPGPKGLPYIGTMLKYRRGKYSSLTFQC
jgi:hypothetical protein